jgi:hypothetical protein
VHQCRCHVDYSPLEQWSPNFFDHTPYITKNNFHAPEYNKPIELNYIYLELCVYKFIYGLDDRAIGVRSPAGAKDFSSTLCIQTGSGAHPASCPVGTGGPFPGGKARPGRDVDYSPPSSAEVVNE